jgi:subtilase family serine protease
MTHDREIAEAHKTTRQNTGGFMTFRNLHFSASITALAVSSLLSLPSYSLPLHNVPSALAKATDQGRVASSTELNLTVVLKLHNRAEFDALVDSLHDPSSSNYHKWLTSEDIAKYAPTEAEYATVKNELLRHGFSVTTTDSQRLTLRVHGTAANAEEAFQTTLHNFTSNGKTFRAHVSDAKLTGEAADLVDSVAGLERHTTQPKLSYVKNPLTGKQLVKKTIASTKDLSSFANSLTDAPLTATSSVTWSDGSTEAVYSGLQYAANGDTVAFTPAQLQDHYGLTSLIKQGYDGTGQTIALVEAYGYPSAKSDANQAAKLWGLPELTSKNFSVVYPEGKPLNSNAAELTGWDGEIALDIQSAHAIAPGAKILVVASAGQDNEDQIASLNYIISNHLANSVSGSWENDDEIISGSAENEAFNTVLETGVAQGISFQFSSGDSGDLGLGTPVGAVSVPSNSPYATAVGGTSILNNPYTDGQIVTGWGDSIVYLYDGGIEDPPYGENYAGAGGGQSQYFKKPSWQSALSGKWRQVPDVAALADPFTGFPILLTESGTLYAEVYGGTSLASPIFTANWAIANQYGGTALGQASRVISQLKKTAIADVVPPADSIAQYNVTGSITDSTGVTEYTAGSLLTASGLDLYKESSYLDAIWPYDSSFYLAVVFGTDESLLVTKGWDHVTGWGEPNGLPFIKGVTGKTKGAALSK